jgi:hypothetical protein
MSLSVAAQDTTSVEGPRKSSAMASLNFSQVSLTNRAQGPGVQFKEIPGVGLSFKF